MRSCVGSSASVARCSLAHVARAGPTDAADARLIEACGANAERCEPLTPARRVAFEQAAALYEAAFAVDPSRSALQAAFAAKHVGDFARATRNYERLLSSTYVAETTLKTLEQTSSGEYQQRLKLIALALDEEGAASYAQFAYDKAAEVYLRIATHARLPLDKRADAGKNALILFSALGNRQSMLAANASLQRLQLAPDVKVNLDYVVASFDFQQWKPSGPVAGPNNQARLGAIGALSSFYNSHASSELDYHEWYKRTVSAWALLRSSSPVDAERLPFADHAAEAEFVPLDEEIRDTFDYSSGHAQYVRLTPPQIFGGTGQAGGRLRQWLASRSSPS